MSADPKPRGRWDVPAAQLGVLAILLALDQWAVDSGLVGDLYLATPVQVAGVLRDFFASGSIWEHLVLTLGEFAAGLVLGVGTGLAVARSPLVERFSKPYLSGLMAIPKVAILPLLTIWLGIGFGNKLVLVFLFSFFPIAYNTIAGIKGTSEGHVKVARVFEASPAQLVLKVLLPSAVPTIFAGIRVAAATGFVGAIFAEMQASRKGLGYLLVNASQLYDTKQVFAVVVVSTAVSILIIQAVDLVEKRVFLKWKYSK